MYFLDFSCLTAVSAKPTLALVLPLSLLDQCIFQVNWNKPVILRNETTNESVWGLFQNFLWNISVVFTKLDWKLEMLEKSSVQFSLARVCHVILFLWKAFDNTQPRIKLLNHSVLWSPFFFLRSAHCSIDNFHPECSNTDRKRKAPYSNAKTIHYLLVGNTLTQRVRVIKIRKQESEKRVVLQ